MHETNKAIKKLIYRDCWKAMLPSTVLYILGEGITGLISVYTAYILGEFADSVFRLDTQSGVTGIWKLVICVGITVLVIPAISLIGELVMFANALKHDRMVMDRFFSKTYGDAKKIEEGEAQYRIENDPNGLRQIWQDVTIKAFTVPFELGYLLYHALHVSWLYTLIVFAVSLAKIIVPAAVRKLEAKYDWQTREYNTQVRKYETEIAGKPHIVKMYGLKNALIERLDNIYHEYFKNVQTKSIKLKEAAISISSLLDVYCILIILIAGTAMTARGVITPGAIAAMAGYFSVFNLIISNIEFIIRNIPILKNMSERIIVLYSNPENLSGENIDEVMTISARDLSFAYDEKEVFSGLNFEIQDGIKTVVCGPNGAGKSTLLQLLCGLLKGYKGSLKLNGKEFRSVAVESWRKQIAYVPQEPFLFAGTVRENISLGLGCCAQCGNNADAVVDAVIEQLGIQPLAERTVSMGLNNLSGGEKQKISIARSLVKGAELIILDEPGNNLDRDSLNWLLDFIRETDKTLVYISHDKEFIKAADRVIQL